MASLLRPKTWGIAARSAAVSAAVVLVALTVAVAGLLALLHGVLLSGVEDAADARVSDIVVSLQTNAPEDVDEGLLATDQRVAAVQIVNADGIVVRHSPGTSLTPLASASEFDASPGVALPESLSPNGDMLLSGETVSTSSGSYLVVVGGASEAVNATVRTVALLLASLTPIVIIEAAFVSYLLIKRSLRSVDAIRTRVADISTSDLSERVPVPQSQDEIASLATTMNEMLARVEAGHRAQRQFVSDASHELRSPLATILSALEVVESHPHLLNQDLVTHTLLPEAQRMRVLVEDLLMLARADENGLKLRHDEVRLDSIIESEAARLRQDSTLEIHTHVESVHIAGDVDALTRMVRNLLDNAVRHTSQRIEISLRNVTDVTLSISDDGPGIPESQRKRVFDRFVRLDSDRSRHSGGTGLGLAIVAEIVSAHEGSITVDDAPRGGARITVTLPSRQ